MIQRTRKAAVFAALFSATVVGGCVSRPEFGISDEVQSEEPWTEDVTIAGVVLEGGSEVTLEVATTKEGFEFDQLTTVTSSGNVIVSENAPDRYEWSATLKIARRYWFAGVSGGLQARLRATSQRENTTFVLGTSENPFVKPLCDVLDTLRETNPGAFLDLQEASVSNCSRTLTPDEQIFAFRTSAFNDSCGATDEACCTVGTPCGSGLVCNDNKRCRPPETSGGGPATPGGSGGVAEGTKCKSDDPPQLVSDFRPAECPAGFKLTGFRRCVNGKLSQPTAASCSGNLSENPPGADCYCTIGGGDCGEASNTTCTPGNQDCQPGLICAENYPWGNGVCSKPNNAEVPDCWLATERGSDESSIDEIPENECAFPPCSFEEEK